MINHIYCDESRQSRDRYMVLGGIIVGQEHVQGIIDTMKVFRNDFKMLAELKWSKVSHQKLNEYKGFIDYFFALCNTNKVHFHCLVIDNHNFNNKISTFQTYDIGFYKCYYQLLLHCFGLKYHITDVNSFIVYLDERSTKYKLSDLKAVLNNGIRLKKGIKETNEYPFIAIEPRSSKLEDIIQINDILIGAVGYQKNGYHLLAGAKKAKIELAEYIANKAGLSNLINSTSIYNSRFTIWNFRPKVL